jgi:hypothetical protein
MIGPLVQMVLLVSITHGFRFVGSWISPRRSGLLMGLPSTTALVLVYCGLERGLDEAAGATEGCLLGLAAAVALPLAYARAAAAGWRSPAATAAALAGYVTVAAALWWVPKPGASGCVAVAAAGVAAACQLGTRIRPGGSAARGRGRPLTAAGRVACRTAVPAAYFLMIRSLRAFTGAGFAGRFITFPGGSLSVLVTTHLEAGPETACRMAAGMPTGGLVMLAFLAAFRFGCPWLGLGWGTAVGFAAALVTLGVVGALSGRDEPGVENAESPRPPRRPRYHAAHAGGRPARARSGSPSRGDSSRSGGLSRGSVRRRPRPPRSRFAPRVEALTG